jgi:hypothetical protein
MHTQLKELIKDYEYLIREQRYIVTQLQRRHPRLDEPILTQQFYSNENKIKEILIKMERISKNEEKHYRI